jgi:glyoxylase-like metal-dependent hydrolase (beta-lactamase superfamily II)
VKWRVFGYTRDFNLRFLKSPLFLPGRLLLLSQKIIALIAEMGVTIKLILVTHGHFDHFLAAEEVRFRSSAPGDDKWRS